MNTREQIAFEQRLKDVTIDINGKGPMVVYAKGMMGREYFHSIVSPVSGHEPESAFEMRKAALIGRRHAQAVLEACDNMDRLVAEALAAKEAP